MAACRAREGVAVFVQPQHTRQTSMSDLRLKALTADTLQRPVNDLQRRSIRQLISYSDLYRTGY